MINKHGMNISILKSFNDIEPYLHTVQSHADNHKNEFGFLPQGAYQAQALQEKLWIAVENKKQHYLGHLMFGGTGSCLKVFQIYVHEDFQKQGIAERLLEEFVNYGESKNYLSIVAKVAADLPANNFWDKTGFTIIRQDVGGKVKNRKINIRVKELDTPSLFQMMTEREALQTLRFVDDGPIFSTPTYVLDLNVVLDIIKDRCFREEAAYLMGASFNNLLKLCVTPEFLNELERNTQGREHDPLIEFARHLPSLPHVGVSTVANIIADLRLLVFPNRKPGGRTATQDNSDLIHLASCIHHRVDGFLTRENAILRARKNIKEKYKLEILSPSDCYDPIDVRTVFQADLKPIIAETPLNMIEGNNHNQKETEAFLKNMGLEDYDIRRVCNPGTSTSPRTRLGVKTGNDILGIASWDESNQFRSEQEFHLYVNEEHHAAERIIDHMLEVVSRGGKPLQLRKISLHTSPKQTKTRQTAIRRGFCSSFDIKQQKTRSGLRKVSLKGFVTPENWPSFANDFNALTGLQLPSEMPTLKEFQHTGILLKSNNETRPLPLKLFEFETLISPAVLLPRKRNGILIPIRYCFAKDLLYGIRNQMELFNDKEALFHVEKAYFRSNRNIDIFNIGQPLVIYVSGKGALSKCAIGIARVTFSKAMNVEEAKLRLARQGVLNEKELGSICDTEGLLHAITFDNFMPFTETIAYKTLKKIDSIGKANFITAEEIPSDSLKKICEIGFQAEGVNI